MKKIHLISAILLMTSSQMSAQMISDYFPARVGNYWVQHTDSLRGQYMPTTFRQEYERTDMILGKEYLMRSNRMTADDNSSDAVWYQWLRSDSVGQYMGAFGQSQVLNSASVYDPPIRTSPGMEMGVDAKWDFDFPEGGGHYWFHMQSTSETVVVPAGTFVNCLNFRMVIINAGGDTTQVNQFYVAPGVGEVLNVQTFPPSNRARFELTEYFVQSVSIENGLEPGVPNRFTLRQNYPNPFNPRTTISYSIPRNERVELSVYNTLGSRVALLVNNFKPAGEHIEAFEAGGLPSGLYFYRLTTGIVSRTRKMVLLR
jgi:Secretion system C-terminal sorting domain